MIHESCRLANPVGISKYQNYFSIIGKSVEGFEICADADRSMQCLLSILFGSSPTWLEIVTVFRGHIKWMGHFVLVVSKVNKTKTRVAIDCVSTIGSSVSSNETKWINGYMVKFHFD